MEYLIFAILLYFIAQTAGNLVRLVRGDGASGQIGDGGPWDATGGDGAPGRDWGRAGSRRRVEADDDPTYWGRDIEDATWTDLDN